MPIPLPPDRRLRRLPGEALPLPDGRWLLRHAGGVSLLGGQAAAMLPRLLELAEAGRTVGEIASELRSEIPEAQLRRLLASLLGELLEVEAEEAPASSGSNETPPASERPVLLLGSGSAAAALAARLEREGLPVEVLSLPRSPSGLDPGRLNGAALVVVAAEETSYRDLFDLQSACLAAGVPSLFLTADPDGLRAGPLTVPGVSPCLGCAQLAALGFLGRESAEVLAVAGGLRTCAAPADVLGAAAEAVAAEAREVLDPDGSPALLAGLLLLTPHGGRRLPVSRSPACPLCGSLEPAGGHLAQRAARRLLADAERRRSLSLYPDEAAASGAEPVRTVGILGGGTAGYLTALALRRKHPHLAVTLLESPDVPIIGVGEATTPLLPQFLHVDLGLGPVPLFREVGPTLKLGIRFLWGEPGSGDFPYPFGPVHPLEAVAYDGTIAACALQARLMAEGAVPLYREGEGGDGWRPAFGTTVAYHLDNERFVAYLQRQAEAAGVERVLATVAGVERSADGEEVAALVGRDGRRFVFDLYVDASGFRSLLLEKTLESPWIDFRSSLWTDRAVVGPVPLDGPVRPYTTATTFSAGWCWSTPQLEADHRGYVFASAFQSPEAAEAEMRAACPGMGEARLVRFRAGRHAHFWKGNVVALGNSYGFVEPLESTALHMLVRQIGLLIQAFPLHRGEHGLPERLNRRVAAWWDYLRWFLALHYRFNRRFDTPFWRACREEVDVSAHGELLQAFRERGPLSADPALAGAVDFPDPLWGPEGIDLLLLGQGVRPDRPLRPALHPAAWAERQRLARMVAEGAASHQQALAVLGERPDLLARFVRPFQAAGPAFAVERRVGRAG